MLPLTVSMDGVPPCCRERNRSAITHSDSVSVRTSLAC